MGKQIYYHKLRNDDPDTIRSHISYLEQQHKSLDEQIKRGHTNYLDDEHLGKMKHEKLGIKRKIVEFKQKLEQVTNG